MAKDIKFNIDARDELKKGAMCLSWIRYSLDG